MFERRQRKSIVALCLLVWVGCGDDAVSASGTEGESTTSMDASGTASVDPPGSTTTSTPPSTTTSADPSEDSSSEGGSGSSGDEPRPELLPLEGPSVSVGFDTACQVGQDGSLSCWGSAACGRFGDGTEHARGPSLVSETNEWSSVSLAVTHGCGIKDDATLWCWGDGRSGKVGDGELDQFPFSLNCRLHRVELEPLGEWAQVSTGAEHSCAVRRDGTLWCWGSNESGQIGDGALGDLYNRVAPVQVGPDDDWVEVFAASEHTCGRKHDDTLWCWGMGFALGDGGGPSVSSIPVMVAGPSSWRSLPRGARARHTCAIDAEGGLWCWGQEDWGVLGPNAQEGDGREPIAVPLSSPAVSVAVGSTLTCAALDDGTVWCWGRNWNEVLGLPAAVTESADPVQIEVGLSAEDVRVGGSTVCTVAADGTAVCWGDNETGAVGDHTSGADNSPRLPSVVGESAVEAALDDWQALATAGGHTCGIRTDDSLWCWGNRYNGQLGNADEAEDCSPANPTSCHVTTPVEVAGDRSWSEVTVGTRHTCARDLTGGLWCWGSDDGATGVGATNVPLEVEPATSWDSVAAGAWHSCAVRDDGTLWCWGASSFGQLGLGTQGSTPAELAPVQVGTDTDWSQVFAGARHTCGLRTDDSLWCWGANLSGQIGNGEMTEGRAVGAIGVDQPFQVPGAWAHVALGDSHSCALDLQGALWCWGTNVHGASGQDPSDTTSVLTPTQVGTDTHWEDLALAGLNTCGRTDEGRVQCWGSRAEGLLGDDIFDDESWSHEPVQVGPDDAGWTTLTGTSRAICGVRSDGSGWCWGQNYSGRHGNDTVFPSATPRRVVQ